MGGNYQLIKPYCKSYYFKNVSIESSIADDQGVWWIGAMDPVTGDEKDLFL